MEGGGDWSLKEHNLRTLFGIKVILYIHRYNDVLFFVPGIKDGVPTDKDLQLLSRKLGEYWRDLARCLGFEEPEIIAFHKENEELREKALKMLLQWRAKYGSGATFRVLYDALCDECVGQTELAEKYCCLS